MDLFCCSLLGLGLGVAVEKSSEWGMNFVFFQRKIKRGRKNMMHNNGVGVELMGSFFLE